MPEPEITRETKPLHEVARILAHWWADFLRRDHCPSLLCDAGYTKDSFENGLFGDAMLCIIKARQTRLTPEQCQAFEEALADVLLNGFEWEFEGGKIHENGLSDHAANSLPGAVHLGVDYAPCIGLREACQRVGIDSAYRFPFKTHSWASAQAVRVSAGSRAPLAFLWSTKRSWARDQAEQRFCEAHPFPHLSQGEAYNTPAYQVRVERYLSANAKIGEQIATVDDNQQIETMIAELLRLAEVALAGHD